MRIPLVLYFRGRENALSRMYAIPKFGQWFYLSEVWRRVPAKPFRYTEGGMRQRPRLVLLFGFGGLLLLMGAAEMASLLLLHSLRQGDMQLQERFLARNRMLEQIRSHIYLSGTLVRDSLLAPEPSGARAQLAALDGF